MRGRSDRVKHFLDTSVVRPMLHGLSGYRNYLRDNLPGKRYISPYVEMEYVRSVIMTIIEFYFLLQMPTVRNAAEAFDLWAEKFESRKVKVGLQLASQVLRCRRIDLADPTQKGSALNWLAHFIRRALLSCSATFTNIGRDETRCVRARIKLGAGPVTADRLQQFYHDFDECKARGRRCRMTDFLQTRHKAKLLLLANDASWKPSANLQKLLGSSSECTCIQCSRIGDAVIAVQAPDDMEFVHTDLSFDSLCPQIGKKHRRLLAQRAWHKEISAPALSTSADDV